MDKTIQAGQIWKRRKDGVYIVILEYDGKRWIKVRRADTRHHWEIEDWGLRRKYFLPDQDYLCRPCLVKESDDSHTCVPDTESDSTPGTT